MNDFKLQKYEELCQELKNSSYNLMTFHNYLSSQSADGSVCILRHDVDRKLRNALIMAKLEDKLGVKSTYYFRYPYTFNQDIIRNISLLGHEIGYHYETLAKAEGDREKAIVFFEQELKEFRKIADVKTICMHGSPLSKYDNRDLWKWYDFSDFGIEGEAYLSMAEANVQYLTDTGRSWSAKHSIRDVMPGATKALPVESTNDLIRYIRSSRKESFYLTIHPERWAGSNKEWIVGYAKDLAVNTAKSILMAIR